MTRKRLSYSKELVRSLRICSQNERLKILCANSGPVTDV